MGHSSPLPAPPRHSTEGPSTCPQHCPCKDDLTAPSRTARAQMPRPAGPCCLYPLEPSSTGHLGNSYLAHPVIPKTSQCLTLGLETTGPQGVHPRCTLCTWGMATQPPAQPTETELGTESSPQAQVLSPEGRVRDEREQESPITSLTWGISPCTAPQRYTSITLLAPADHKGNPVPLHRIILSARAHRSHKGSKKACRLQDSLTWAQTGRTQEILSQC